MKNPQKDTLTPTLGSYDSKPFTKTQLVVGEEIRKTLLGEGYEEMTEQEMREVVPDIEFLEDATIFGDQMRVEFLVFQDILDLCGKATN